VLRCDRMSRQRVRSATQVVHSAKRPPGIPVAAFLSPAAAQHFPVRRYSRLMGQPPTAAKIRRTLSEALSEYQEQAARGADMAEAGRQLAGVVERIFDDPICGMPRSEYLRELREERDRVKQQRADEREIRDLERGVWES